MERYEAKKVVIIGGTSGMGLAKAKTRRGGMENKTSRRMKPRRP